MYPQYMCTRVYAHKRTVCAHTRNTALTYVHTQEHIYIQCIRIKSFTAYISLYTKYVYRGLSVLILPASCHSSTHVATRCADNPCCACLRSPFGFVFNKRRTSRKSALYKEPSIRTRALYLRKEPCISANEPCIFAQESCISAQKKRRADTHID
jgi:hypothetical protein